VSRSGKVPTAGRQVPLFGVAGQMVIVVDPPACTCREYRQLSGVESQAATAASA
jgi:hypothetical protein